MSQNDRLKNQLKTELKTAADTLDGMVKVFEVMFDIVRSGRPLSVTDIVSVEQHLPGIRDRVEQIRAVVSRW